jgi:type I restriction enzyme R subunit
LIVLDGEVQSMTEFKQIVGRGTRVHEDTKKYYFTLMDFRKASNQFADPDFDGPPVQIYEPGVNDPVAPPDEPPASEGDDPVPPEPGADEEILVDPNLFGGGNTGGGGRRSKYYIKGKPVHVATERVEYLDANGKLVTESLRDYTKKAITKRLASLDEFLTVWNATDRKQTVLQQLAEEGLLFEPILEEVGKDLDPFDLIWHVAFDRPPLTRKERAANVRKRDVFAKYGAKARAVLEALLAKYQDEGVTGLDDMKLLTIPPLSAIGTPLELVKTFGGREGFEQAVREMQAALYQLAG